MQNSLGFQNGGIFKNKKIMYTADKDKFFVRPAANEDIPLIKNVVFTVLREYGLKPDEAGKDKDLNDIEKNYFSSGGFFGVIVNNTNNQVVGTFGLFAIDKDICELRKMYLLKNERGKGIGRFMMTYAIKIAEEKKFKKITLETISPLKEAISLYRKFGFKEISPVEINSRVDQAFELILKNNS
jgi:putative acetyltransferase